MKNFLANLCDLARAAADEIVAHLTGDAVVIDQTTRALCVVPGRPHAATDGRLCRDHLEELGRWLHEIETEAKRVSFDADDPDSWSAVPSMSSRLGQGGGGSLASQQAPVVVDAIVYADRRTTAHGHRHIGPVCYRCPILVGLQCICPPLEYRRQVHWSLCARHGAHPSCLAILADRDEYDARAERLVSVYNVLHGLAQRVRDERMFGVPVCPVLVRVPPGHEGVYAVDPAGVIGAIALVPATLSVATERDLLSRQLDWIAGQDWILDMRTELAQLRTELLRHNRNEDDRPLTGYCYRIVDDQGTECRGNLLPAAPVHSTGPDTDAELEDDGPHRPRAVVCERNPLHRWEGRDLARLSLILEQQRRDDARAAAPLPPPAPTERPQLRVVSTAGQGDRLDALLEEQRREEQRRGDDAS